MTVIAALVDGDRVLMGADRIGTQWDETRMRLEVGKLRHGEGPGGRYALGCAGQRRVNQETVIRWEPPTATPATFPYAVAASLERHFRSDAGLWDLVVSKEHGTLQGRWLLGWRSRIWHIGCDFTVDELSDPFWAIGCAADYAMGALSVTEGMDLAPLDRLGMALDAAAQFDVHVVGPFDVVTT